MLALRTFFQISNAASLHQAPRVIVGFALLMTGFCNCQSFAGQQSAARPDANGLLDDTMSVEDRSIAQLLGLLDSPLFASRQMATTELTRRGADAVGPMAKHYLSSSPEAAWRIKKSLEAIGTNGDEATFLKSVGLLQLLVGNNSTKLNEQLDRLKLEWMQKQTQMAIDKLRGAGAEINNVAAARRAKVAFSQKGLTKSVLENKSPRRSDNLTLKQKSAAIEKIVKGSLKSNRKLVLGTRPTIKAKLTESQKMVQALERQLAQKAIGRAGNIGFGPGVIVTFGKTWKGKRPQFAELRNVEGLSQIIFERQYIDKFTLTMLSELTSVTALEFNKCRFSGPALATVGLPEFVKTLRFRNLDIEVSTIDRISKLNVTSLLFDNCDFSLAAMNKMLALSSVNYLELVNQELTSSDFKRLEKLKTLTQLKLSGTRFPFRAYKALTASRPDLFFDFTTTAFLGVRSVQGLRDSCQISDVISDSGAEKGGLKINDVILKVNGHEIEQFNDLRANIALRKPGEVLKLTIKREGEIVELNVKLGDFEDAPSQ